MQERKNRAEVRLRSTKSTKTNKHTLRKEERKLFFVKTFIPLFSSEGIDQPTLEELGLEADVNKMILVRYFGNRDNIVIVCAEYARPIVQNGLTEVVKKDFGEEDFYDKLLNYIDNNSDICRFMLQIIAHPMYREVISDSEVYVIGEIENWAAIIEERTECDLEHSLGFAYLMNSLVNEYILKGDKEEFYRQVNFINGIYK